MIRRWQTASIALILLLAANSTTAASARIGIVTAGTLNVRAKPARHFERLGKFRRGDAVKVVRETDEWLEVVVPTDAKAWVARQHLDAKGAVTATSLQVRSGPGIVFTTYAKVAKGTTLKLVGPPLDEWQRILPPEGATGWVNRAYVRLQDQRVTVVTKPETPAPAKPEDTGLTVAKVPSKLEPAPPAKPAAKPIPPARPAAKPIPPAKPVAVEKPPAPVAKPPPTKVTGTPSAEPGTGSADETASEYISKVVRRETGVEVIIEAQKPVRIVETPEPKEPAVAPKPKVVETAEQPEPKKPVVAPKPKVVETAEQPEPKKPVVVPVPKKVVEIAEQPEPKKPVVDPKPKIVETAKQPEPEKPVVVPVPKKVVEIAKQPEPKPESAKVPVAAVAKPKPKAVPEHKPAEVIETPKLEAPIVIASRTDPVPIPDTPGEETYKPPLRTMAAPTVPRPALRKPRYEVPAFVAKATPRPEAADPEPVPTETDVSKQPEVPPEHVLAPSADPPAAAPVPESPAVVPMDPARPERTWQEGVLFSLKQQAVPEASHILYRREGTLCYPICYLRSTRIPLAQWEMREVRLYGEQINVPGWSRPIIDVQGLQLKALE